MMDKVDQAIRLMDQGKTDESIKLMDQAWPLVKEDVQFSIAHWYEQLGFLHKSIEIIESLLQNDEEDLELRLQLIDYHIELGNDEKAISLLEEIPEVDEADPNFVQSSVQLADLYQAQGFFESAEEKLLAAKRVSRNEPLVDLALAELYFSEGFYKKALIYYEILEKEQIDVPGLSIVERMAECLASIGDYERSLEKYSRLKKENPNEIFNHALVAYQAKNYQMAIKLWKDLLDKNQESHVTYVYLAKAYENIGDLSAAYDTSLLGLEKDEFNKDLYYNCALYASKLGRQEEARKYAEEAVALDPDFKQAVLLLIDLYKVDHHHNEIIDLIESIQEIGAIDAYYEWELARSYNETEQYEKASSIYEKVYDSLMDNEEFMKEYGFFLVEDGQIKKGLHILQSYLELNKEDEHIMEYIERLQDNE